MNRLLMPITCMEPTAPGVALKLGRILKPAGALPMIAFHDFIPRRQGKRFLGMLTDYENLHELVSRVNLWIEQHHIDVLNVETVVVTSLPKETEASPKAEMTSQINVSSTYQIVRVWYRQTIEAERAYTGETTRLSSD